MLGLIVSGRLVQTDFQLVGQTQYVTTVADADNINHIVVFLTGTQPFPEGFGGSVYFSWPNPQAPPTWQRLGFISNAKPSAIFKITKLKNDPGTSSLTFGQPSMSHNAQIGISIEPLTEIMSQSTSVAEPSTAATFMEFARSTLQNLFNYTASFAVSQSQMMPNPTETFVPMTALKNWYSNFQHKLERDPNFWKNF